MRISLLAIALLVFNLSVRCQDYKGPIIDMHEDGSLNMYTRPLDLNSLLMELEE